MCGHSTQGVHAEGSFGRFGLYPHLAHFFERPERAGLEDYLNLSEKLRQREVGDVSGEGRTWGQLDTGREDIPAAGKGRGCAPQGCLPPNPQSPADMKQSLRDRRHTTTQSIHLTHYLSTSIVHACGHTNYSMVSRPHTRSEHRGRRSVPKRIIAHQTRHLGAALQGARPTAPTQHHTHTLSARRQCRRATTQCTH